MLGLLVFAFLQGAELRESDVKPLILEFCTEKPTLDRAREILTTLRQADPIIMQRPFAAILSEEKEGSKRAQRALRLAGSLRVPGLYKEVAKYIGGEADQDAVMTAVSDPAAFVPLFDRWMKLDPGSAEFKYVDAALRTSRHVDLAFLSKFQGAAVIAEGEKKDLAARMVAYQCGSGETDRQKILDAWPKLRDEFVRDSKTFPITGENLLSRPGVEVTGCRLVGKNVRIGKGGSLKIPLSIAQQEGSHIIKFSILAIDPGLRVQTSLKMQNGQTGVWSLAQVENDWGVKSGNGAEAKAPAKWRRWSTVQFVVKGNSRKESETRSLAIYVDDVCILPNGLYSITDDFSILADEGDAVVAGLELIRTKGK